MAMNGIRASVFFFTTSLFFFLACWQNRWGKALSAWDYWEVCWGWDIAHKIWHTLSLLQSVKKKLLFIRGVRHMVFLIKGLGMWRHPSNATANATCHPFFIIVFLFSTITSFQPYSVLFWLHTSIPFWQGSNMYTFGVFCQY